MPLTASSSRTPACVWSLTGLALLASLQTVPVTTAAFASEAAPSPGPAGRSQRSLPGEAMYPLASADAWRHVQETLKELRFRAETLSTKNQLLTTAWTTYNARAMPDAGALGLAPGDWPRRVQLHVMVARERQPARVMVGSILEFERPVAGRRQRLVRYGVEGLEAWVFEAVARRAGVRHSPMPHDWKERAAQAAAMMPEGLSDPCLGVTEREPTKRATQPLKLHDVQPVFPAQGFDAGSGRVLLTGRVTEHGSVSDLTVPDPSEKWAFYESSARAATSLWRFEPAMVDGCPVVVPIVLTVSYTIR